MTELRPGARVLALRSFTLPPATQTNAFVLGEDDLVLVDPGKLAAEGRVREHAGRYQLAG